MTELPASPPLALALTELPRAAADAWRLVPKLRRIIREQVPGDGHPVLVLPGYGAADGSTQVLRYFLKRLGYQTFGLAAGRNVEGLDNRIQSIDDASRFRGRLVDVTIERVSKIYAETGERVSLVGWSMGGLYAFDASQQAPDLVRTVVTLGAPFGDLRGTSVFNVMRRLSGSTVPLESQDFDGWSSKACAAKVPTHVIYSHRDGIVGREVARLPTSSLLTMVQVDSSHLSFTVNAEALAAVAEALAGSPKR